MIIVVSLVLLFVSIWTASSVLTYGILMADHKKHYGYILGVRKTDIVFITTFSLIGGPVSLLVSLVTTSRGKLMNLDFQRTPSPPTDETFRKLSV